MNLQKINKKIEKQKNKLSDLFRMRDGIWNYRKYYIQHSPRHLTVGVYDGIYGEYFYQLI